MEELVLPIWGICVDQECNQTALVGLTQGLVQGMIYGVKDSAEHFESLNS